MLQENLGGNLGAIPLHHEPLDSFWHDLKWSFWSWCCLDARKSMECILVALGFSIKHHMRLIIQDRCMHITLKHCREQIVDPSAAVTRVGWEWVIRPLLSSSEVTPSSITHFDQAEWAISKHKCSLVFPTDVVMASSLLITCHWCILDCFSRSSDMFPEDNSLVYTYSWLFRILHDQLDPSECLMCLPHS